MTDEIESTAVGFPSEPFGSDRPVILTPELARALRAGGFLPVAENGIGERIGVADEDLDHAGVRFARRDEVNAARLLLKYKPFSADEITACRPEQTLGAVFHAEGRPDLLTPLLRSGVRAYSYEFLTEDGRFPLMRAGGTIAGIQAVFHAAHALQTYRGGRGVLLAAVDGCPPPKVVVIGSGNVGLAAADTAAGLGADVLVLCRTAEARDHLLHRAENRCRAQVNSPEALARELPDTDVLIGAILISTYTTPAMITPELVRTMRPGSVIVDATAGYGPGYLPSAGPVQQPGEPPREVHGVLHVKIDVLPSVVPVTSSRAYTAAAAPYLVRLAERVLRATPDPVVDTALIVAGGEIRHPVLAEHAGFYDLVPG
ncbi:hypothetical protein [Amycolatopsis sp. NPDC098790]|uniref:hypothetical protein n=1 Tax=Amycolatopsis sp. NPDC098790 TaxID=3363939 RepID=UPI0037F626A0